MLPVLVKYPSRARPDIFRPVLEMYLKDPTVRVLVTADNDDSSMNTPEMREWLQSLDRVKVRWGECKTKVEAINDGIADELFEILIVGSDDMIVQRPDYAQRICQLFDEFHPDGDGVLHLDDGRRGQGLNTLPIMDRKYFDRFGYCYHHDYVSLFCDDEMTQVSEALGRSAYVPEVVIKHEWVAITGHDELHVYNENFYHIDQHTFRKRKAAGFPI